MRAYAHNSNISNLRFKTLSLLRWISYRDIDRNALRSEMNRVIDNTIYWFGYCVIYKQKKIGYFPKQPIFKKLTFLLIIYINLFYSFESMMNI